VALGVVFVGGAQEGAAFDWQMVVGEGPECGDAAMGVVSP